MAMINGMQASLVNSPMMINAAQKKFREDNHRQGGCCTYVKGICKFWSQRGEVGEFIKAMLNYHQ